MNPCLLTEQERLKLSCHLLDDTHDRAYFIGRLTALATLDPLFSEVIRKIVKELDIDISPDTRLLESGESLEGDDQKKTNSGWETIHPTLRGVTLWPSMVGKYRRVAS